MTTTMLHIPAPVQGYIDMVPGLREHAVNGHIATPLTRDVVNKLLSMSSIIEASFTETAENKAIAAKLKIQAVLMSTEAREYLEELVPNHHLPLPLSSACSEIDCKHGHHDHKDHKEYCTHVCTHDKHACHEKCEECCCDLPHGHGHTHPHVVLPPPKLPSGHHAHGHAHDECHATFRKRYAELKEQYARRHAELKETYERKYAHLKAQYVERELEIKCKYDERHHTIKHKYNELKRRYESLRGAKYF